MIDSKHGPARLVMMIFLCLVFSSPHIQTMTLTTTTPMVAIKSYSAYRNFLRLHGRIIENQHTLNYHNIWGFCQITGVGTSNFDRYHPVAAGHQVYVKPTFNTIAIWKFVFNHHSSDSTSCPPSRTHYFALRILSSLTMIVTLLPNSANQSVGIQKVLHRRVHRYASRERDATASSIIIQRCETTDTA